MSPTFKVDARTSRVINASPGWAYGRIDPDRIGEIPIPTLLFKTEGAAINKIENNTVKYFVTTLRFERDFAPLLVLDLAME